MRPARAVQSPLWNSKDPLVHSVSMEGDMGDGVRGPSAWLPLSQPLAMVSMLKEGGVPLRAGWERVEVCHQSVLCVAKVACCNTCAPMIVLLLSPVCLTARKKQAAAKVKLMNHTSM